MRNLIWLCLPLLLFLCFIPPQSTRANRPNPTPPVVVVGTPTATETVTVAAEGDQAEPNNSAENATVVGIQTLSDLTLSGADLDYFTGLVKAGQTVVFETTVFAGLDTKITLYWAGAPLATNDDKTPMDVGSALQFTAPGDGWFTLLVEKVGGVDGVYDLAIFLAESPTPQPTTTPQPTATPLAAPDLAEPNNFFEAAFPITVGASPLALTLTPSDPDYFKFVAKAGQSYQCETESDAVDTLLTIHSYGEVVVRNDDRSPARVDSFVSWVNDVEQAVFIELVGRGGGFGSYLLSCRVFIPEPIIQPPLAPVITMTPSSEMEGEEEGEGAETAVSTPSVSSDVPLDAVPLLLRPVGERLPEPALPQTYQLVVYYDQNNNRQADPGEGIANVSVLAVDRGGRRVARVFTNTDGEAVFNSADGRIARFIVPFVSSWSARAVANQPAALGLPAVRIPVFLPLEASDVTR